MKKNPVYHKEVRMTLRSPKLILSIICFNILLAITGIMCLATLGERTNSVFGTIRDVLEYIGVIQKSADASYYSAVAIYALLALMEALLLTFLMPMMAAETISGERERQTLDLMLATKLSPLEIVLGKLEACVNLVVIILASTLPVLSLVFVFGGLPLTELLKLFLLLLVIAIYFGGMGVFCSALMKRTITAMLATFTGVFLTSVGSLLFVQIFAGIASFGMLEYAGRLFGISLLFNPLVTLLTFLQSQIGNSSAFLLYAEEFYHLPTESFLSRHWLFASVVAQLLATVWLVYWASKCLSRNEDNE